MTNREWIESLTDEELAAWLCDNYPVEVFDGTFFTTGVGGVKSRFTHSELGLIEWLKEQRV